MQKPEKNSVFKNPSFVFFLLFGINLFNYIDRQILFAVFPLIKKDLLLSDAQLGFLASVFMIVYMIYAPLAGFWGDRHSRPKIIGISTIIWSIATAFTGIVNKYFHLVFARSAIGIGEAGYMTCTPAYLSEHFDKSKRARILSYFGIALPLGSALGYLLGGQLGELFGWRKAFFIVALPGIILGFLALKLKDKTRENLSIENKPTFSRYFELKKNKTFIFTSLSQAMATFTLGGLAAWMPTYFHRYLDFSISKAATIFGAITLISATLGTFTGGQVADFLNKFTKRGYFITAGMGFLVSVPFVIMAVFANNKTLAISMFTFALFFVFWFAGPLPAAIVNAVKSNIHSMAFAVNIFIIHALGDALSPTIIGMVSDEWELKIGVIMCAGFLILAAGFAWVAGFYYLKQRQNC